MARLKKISTYFKLRLRNLHPKLPSIRHKGKVLMLAVLFGLLVLWKHFYGVTATNKQHEIQKRANPKTKLILWWRSTIPDYAFTKKCGKNKCVIHGRRDDFANAELILFYASDLQPEDMPLPRNPNTLWVLLHEESPRNVQYISYDDVLHHFNYTSTFSRYSDFPITTQYLDNLTTLTSSEYMLPVGEKTRLRSVQNLAPIIFLQTDCDTMSGREDYVAELMKYIEVDSYGECLRNRQLPQSLTEDYLNNLQSPELYNFVARYKFTIAYENGVCDDYITEKFWRPLIVGSIPIYFGAPTIRDWEPNNKSVIHISDFPNPKALAEFIKKIDANDTEYNTYLDHKYEQLEPIKNKRLLHDMQHRNYDNGDTLEGFECYLCDILHGAKPTQPKMASAKHYDCSSLLHPPMDAPDIIQTSSTYSLWKSIMGVGRCSAPIINTLWTLNKNFTKEQLDSLINSDIVTSRCH